MNFLEVSSLLALFWIFWLLMQILLEGRSLLMYAILDTIRHIHLCHKCGQRFCWQNNLLIGDIRIRGAQIPGATSLWWQYFMMVPNICGLSVQNLCYAAFMALGILVQVARFLGNWYAPALDWAHIYLTVTWVVDGCDVQLTC